MDKITIKDLEIYANHGVFPEENVLGQKFLVTAVLHTSTRKAGLTDDLTASVHYGEVSHLIKKLYARIPGSCWNGSPKKWLLRFFLPILWFLRWI